jgi:hypothetical protein
MMNSLGVDVRFLIAVLLVGCVATFLVSVVAITFVIRVEKRNVSLVQLLHVENKRHTSELLAQSESFNAQLSKQQEKIFMHQEQATLQQLATIRELLNSFSIAASGKPLD